MFDTIYGKDKVQVIGYGTDPGISGGGAFSDVKGEPTVLTNKTTGDDIMTNLNQAIKDSDAKDITVRVKSTLSPYDHNMSIINNGDGTYTLNDTSSRGTSITVDSENFDKYINPGTIKSFYYIKKK